MIIATSAQRNAVNCCPCDWPECAEPRKECESLAGFIYLSGYLPPGWVLGDDEATTTRLDYADGGWFEFTYSHIIEAELGGVVLTPARTTGTTSGAPMTGAVTTTYLGMVSPAAAFTSGLATILAALDFENEDYDVLGGCVAKATPYPPGTAIYRLDFARYRFGVPEGYSTEELPRSTWEMQWDEVYASYEWWDWFDGGMEGAEPDPGPTLVQSLDWTWAGDMESPWSEWFSLNPTEETGEIRVVNVLVKCWKSTRVGVVPTAHGPQIAVF